MSVKNPSNEQLQNLDSKEFDYPETVYVRDIENRVFQVIVLQCLSSIRDISLLDGGLIDHFLEKGGIERARGIAVEQDSQKNAVSVRVEVNIRYGVPIPAKAEEIQTKISEEIYRLTSLHVSCVHVIFKSIILKTPTNKASDAKKGKDAPQYVIDDSFEEEFANEFS